METTRDKPVKVGHVSCEGPVYEFDWPSEAEQFIGDVLAKKDPEGVNAGDYYIDVSDMLPF